ncbi:hypothetical protein COO72_00705 [Bifidobacterium callitrichos]|nr:hypothetical protein COO72_00705 [Bifidobacterium callitrichos]
MANTTIIRSANDYYLSQLLDSKTGLEYVIPRYQREFSWRQQQWEQLFDDLTAEPDGGPHFMGTIIAVSTTDDSLHPTLELVDGQQRMTTLSILLAVLYERLAPRLAEFATSKQRMRIFMDHYGMLVFDDNHPRLTLQAQGDNDIDYRYLIAMVTHESDGPEPQRPRNWGNRRIAKAFKYFERRVDALAEGSEDPLTTLFELADLASRAVLVKIEVPDHASAFTLFESLNDRGMPLSPVDLIKNTMLGRADRETGIDVDKAFLRWTGIVDALGADGGDQERFLRYYWNAFQPKSGVRAVATRSNLIRLYEAWLSESGVDSILAELEHAARVQGLLAGTYDGPDLALPKLRAAAVDLTHARAETGFMPLIWLTVNRNRLGLDDSALAGVARLLTAWFVRRNITGYPATYGIQSLFMSIIHDIETGEPGRDILGVFRTALSRPENMASDGRFEEALRGPLYEDNRDMARFVLAALAEQGMTREFNPDLWQFDDREKGYRWTIEHILPKTEHMSKAWIDALGGAARAEEVRERYAHTLGNLTLSGYNSALGRKTFIEKRDRRDDAGRSIGYRNGLSINADLADRDTWDERAILERTDHLVDQAMRLFHI